MMLTIVLVFSIDEPKRLTYCNLPDHTTPNIHHCITTMSPKLHLYMTPGSCSLVSHIALTEISLPFHTTNVGATRGKPFPKEFLHVNPKARVPSLEIDGDFITETPAILTTISNLAPEKKLLGETDMEKVRALEWMTWLCQTVHGHAFACVFQPRRFVGDDAGEEVFEIVRTQGRKVLEENFAYIEGKLEGKTHAVGDEFTLVDAYLFVFYRWGNVLGIGMREKYPNYARLVDELAKRESVRKTVEVEGISLLNE
jgi:glutathione S-transferase